jgi:hypothetical protein
MSVIDTPDGQAGTFSPQQLLATVPLGAASATVVIPANAETLIVMAYGPGTPTDVTCLGTTTGLFYAVVGAAYPPYTTLGYTGFCDVASAVDRNVTITSTNFALYEWYVYSDAGVHIVTDPNLATVVGIVGQTEPLSAILIAGEGGGLTRAIQVDSAGHLQVIDADMVAAIAAPGAARPSSAFQIAGNDGVDLRVVNTNKEGLVGVVSQVPSVNTGDHPLNELQFAHKFLAASGVCLAAPGAGLRYRIFSVQMVAEAAGCTGELTDAGTGQGFALGSGVGVSATTIPAQGLPLSTNVAANYVLIAGAGTMAMSILYTTETV